MKKAFILLLFIVPLLLAATNDPAIEAFLKTLPNSSNYIREYRQHGAPPRATNIVSNIVVTNGNTNTIKAPK